MDQLLKGPQIGNCCRIGTRSLIMPGVRIGDNAEVGAGSIVTKDIGSGEVWFNKNTQAMYMGKVPENEIVIF